MTEHIETIEKFKTIENQKTEINVNHQALLIQQPRLQEIQRQLQFIKRKLKQLNQKKWSVKQNEWLNLKSDLNQFSSLFNSKQVKKVFQRKFQEEIKLLYDFHLRRYKQSMLRMCFSCCPNWIIKKLKYYKLIDDKFQISISSAQKTPRTIYFYLHLIYIKLFIFLVTLGENKKVEKFNQNNNVLLNQHKKHVKKERWLNKIKPNQNQQKYQKEDKIKQISDQLTLSKLKSQVSQIILNDWKDIINVEEWSAHSYRGFIQINTDAPIETFLDFKDCKLKTNHLINQISSSSFDLRTCLVRKSKHFSKSYQYVLNFLYPDSHNFQLRFWLADNQNSQQNHNTIQKYILLTMRIGIKQKIFRNANLQFRQKGKNWLIHNYVHLKEKQSNRQSQNFDNNFSQNTSYQSVSQAEELDPMKFWWVTYREALIKAIIEVSNIKIKENNNLKKNGRVQNKTNKNNKKEVDNFRNKKLYQNDDSSYPKPNQNIESIDRLTKFTSKNHKNFNNI